MPAGRATSDGVGAPYLKAVPPPLPSPRAVIAAMVQDALGHHRAGRLKKAEQIYRQVLAIDTDADSLHLLGMIAYQQERYSLAVARIEEAIALRGDVSSYHCDLGAALQAESRLQEAASKYQRALALNPNCAIAHVNLGLIFQAEHNLDEALVHCRRALALKPEQLESRRATIRAFEAVRGSDLRTALRFAEVAGASREDAEEALGVLAMWVRDVAVAPFAEAALFHPELRSLAAEAAKRLDEDRLHWRFRLLDEALVAIRQRNASPRLQMERLALEMSGPSQGE